LLLSGAESRDPQTDQHLPRKRAMLLALLLSLVPLLSAEG
jgi:hypothetical protein